MTSDDPYDLNRFIGPQEEMYKTALAELRNGRKINHWMWYIFPQMDGLGYTPKSKRYSIKSEEEARHYLNHPVLRERLLKCVDVILSLEGKSATEIFGSTDDKKLKSSMTLFAYVTDSDSKFARVLERYFEGKRDKKTIELLERSRNKNK